MTYEKSETGLDLPLRASSLDALYSKRGA
jgi:hypothetical protein